MSREAVNAAYLARMGRSSLKAVLNSLADRIGNDTGTCFPSVADIVFRTELDRKTVLACLEELEKKRILVDTGERKGRTKQIKVWKLDVDVLITYQAKASQERNGPIFTEEESQNSVERVPKTGHGTTIEPALKPPPVVALSKSIKGKPVAVQVERIGPEISEFVEAGIWHFGKYKKITNTVGLRISIEKRIQVHGPNAGDLEALKLWKAEWGRIEAAKAAVAAAEVAKRDADEILTRMRICRSEALKRFNDLSFGEQKDAEARFIADKKSNAHIARCYADSGLASTLVEREFVNWLRHRSNCLEW